MLEKILIIALIVWLVWAYRYIGLLLYKIRHASSEYDSSRVGFPCGPNFFRYAVANIFQKVGSYWLDRWPSLRRHRWDFSRRYYQNLCRPWYRYLVEEYKEIYLWPWFKMSPIIIREIKHLRLIWWIDERLNLGCSDWRILRDEVKRSLNGIGIRVLGVREDKERGIYRILLKLPGRVTEILGPCEKGKFPKFQKKAGGCDLRISLESHLFSEKRQAKTNKVMAVVHHHPGIIYQVQFCGPAWRQNFINFFREVVHQSWIA